MHVVLAQKCMFGGTKEPLYFRMFTIRKKTSKMDMSPRWSSGLGRTCIKHRSLRYRAAHGGNLPLSTPAVRVLHGADPDAITGAHCHARKLDPLEPARRARAHRADVRIGPGSLFTHSLPAGPGDSCRIS